MRMPLLCLVVLCACATKDEPAVDTAVAAPSSPALTAQMVDGTWNGTSRDAAADTVVSRWKVVMISDTQSGLIYDGTTDTIRFDRAFDADSMIATSEAYQLPGAPKGTMVKFRSIGRLNGDSLGGTAVLTLASKPDSVVSHVTWTATRQP